MMDRELHALTGTAWPALEGLHTIHGKPTVSLRLVQWFINRGVLIGTQL